MRVLELFSGTHSVGKIAKEKGYEVVSVDIDGRADITTDILEWDYKSSYPKGYFDIIWASPPCVFFSHLRVALFGRKVKGEIFTRAKYEEDIKEKGLPLLRKTQEIIEYFNPTIYFIENPLSGRMKDYLKDLPHYDVSYCKYGYTYRKHTRIWTNKEGFTPKKCRQDCGNIINGKHKNNIGHPKGRIGKGTTKDERYSIPPQLVRELLE